MAPEACFRRSLFLASARSRRHPHRNAHDEATIAVALLHDTMRTPRRRGPRIDELFGPEMGKLVEGLTKLKKLDLVSKKAEQAENLRKLLLAISERRPRASGQARGSPAQHAHPRPYAGGQAPAIAEETMDIYAPLAGRMGMQGMREELESSPSAISTEAHRAVTARLAEIFERNKDVLSDIEKALSTLFEKHAIKAGVKSRQRNHGRCFARWRPSAVLRAAVRHFSAFASSSTRRGLLSRAWRHPHDMVDGARPLQGLHLDA